MVNYIPMNIAPNLITVSGLLLVMFGLSAMLWEDPTMTEQVSTWIYVYLATALFIYQTLDSLDGKQARRTGSSSVLGELFDHGCDAVVSLLLAIIICHVCSYGASIATGICISFQFGIFTVFTFEKRFTYVLRTSIGEFGTIEMHYIYMLFILLRAYFGPDFATADVEFLSSLFHFSFNVQNIMSIIGLFTLLNGV
jgi:phosphatidylglycerophosphate synthase